MNNNLNNNKKNELIYEFGLLLTALIWGSSFPVGKIALAYYSPLFLAMTRYLLGGIIIGIFLNERILTITKKEVISGFACGAIFYFAYLFQIIGLQYTVPSKQSFLAALYVIIVPFLYWIIYKKRPDIYNFAAALLTLIGIYLLTASGPGGFNKGDMITVFSSFLYAAHIALIGYLVKKTDPIILTFLQTITAGIIGLAVSLITEPLPTKFPLAGIFSILYLTIFCTIIAYGIQVAGQKHVYEMKTSILLSLEAVFGTLLSVVFLQDPFTVLMLLGCIIIFIGILTAETKWQFLKKK